MMLPFSLWDCQLVRMCYNVWRTGPSGHCRLLQSPLRGQRSDSTMTFPVNENLIAKVQAVLAPRRDIYWIIGASCAGKSTVCRQLARETGVALYDMDEHIYGSYVGRYNQKRHPACSTWFLAPNPLSWVLSLSPGEFDALNKAVQAESLDLFADDVTTECNGPLLVDGGVTHPAMLARVISPDRIVCIETTAAERVGCWETADDRAEMKSWILALSEPQAMWQKFLQFDDMIAHTIGTECRAAGIRTWSRKHRTSVDSLVSAVAEYFGLRMPTQYQRSTV